MSTRVIERVDEWGERPFTGGYGTLQELAADEFSGVVRAGGAELYMTKGTVVGVRNGDIEDFEGAEGTIREAPTPALPLLAIMQERGAEERAQYYSEDTSIADVDTKLEDGGFTGFIELSENVLSGDYYVVYHRGHSMSVAFVGNAKRLLEDDEAFERANGEVGIYKVYPVDIEPIEIPEPTTPGPDVADQASATAVPDEPHPDADTQTAADTATDSDTDSDTDEETSQAPQDEPTDGGAGTARTEAATGTTGTTSADADQSTARERTETGNSGDVSGGETPASSSSEAGAETDAGSIRDDADGQTGEEATGTSTRSATEADTDADPDRPEPTAGGADTREPSGRQTGEGGSDEPAQHQPRSTGHQRTQPQGEPGRSPRQGGKEQTAEPATSRETGPPASGTGGGHSLETLAIPSLDPERTETDDRGPDVPGPPEEEPAATQEVASQADARTRERDRQPASQPDGHRESSPDGESDASPEEPAQRTGEAQGGESADTERIESLEAKLEDREEEIDRLEADLQAATEDHDLLQDELESVREERDELAAEVERLESELERLETELGAATDKEQRMTPREALDGTDIFVRYHSKGDATLAKAHDGGTRKSDVVDNLRFEQHTQFDADAVAVGGQTYSEFLESTVEFQFVKWIATELLFEIRETGHADALTTLYDALPKIDRAELDGAVDVVYTDEGQETRSTETFDVVLRDRMGDPLVVANLNDSREAATESMMEQLVTAAERVGQTSEGFAAAFLVTESFFEPGALETASEATRGGLLSRNKQKSFVNLSRKRGYHLCLVEARNENFNLTVPEL